MTDTQQPRVHGQSWTWCLPHGPVTGPQLVYSSTFISPGSVSRNAWRQRGFRRLQIQAFEGAMDPTSNLPKMGLTSLQRMHAHRLGVGKLRMLLLDFGTANLAPRTAGLAPFLIKGAGSLMIWSLRMVQNSFVQNLE